jgi:hypothetical protein
MNQFIFFFIHHVDTSLRTFLPAAIVVVRQCMIAFGDRARWLEIPFLRCFDDDDVLFFSRLKNEVESSLRRRLFFPLLFILTKRCA